MMSLGYIVIQAGGKGTRLKHFTTNKPKAIVSINNLPLIFHLFRKYQSSKFIIIGDYKKDVLDRYLEAFCEVDYLTVSTDDFVGTCSGIANALSIIPENSRFMLIWSDLVLDKELQLPNDDDNYIGLSNSFPCRWRFENEKFEEISSSNCGVAGLFVFKNKSVIKDVPPDGEFVRWLQTRHDLKFNKFYIDNSLECGLVEKIAVQKVGKCRPFNSMKMINGLLIKEGVDDQGKKLAIREKVWYKHVSKYGISIPKIYSYEPLTMECIDGKNIFEYTDIIINDKKKILDEIMSSLSHLHEYDRTFTDYFSIYEAYYTKTLNRISKVRNLIPFANEEYIEVNNRKCRNVFFHLEEFRDAIRKLKCDGFSLIHGDCTFSNMMLRNDNKEPVFIDPRGYFGKTEIVGDPNYDWAKLYYSLIGDYDQFNLGRFTLSFEGKKVSLDIETNGWKGLEDDFIKNLPAGASIKDIRLIHAIIWLSLTTYAWDDYDSICGSFYNGLYYLEDVL